MQGEFRLAAGRAKRRIAARLDLFPTGRRVGYRKEWLPGMGKVESLDIHLQKVHRLVHLPRFVPGPGEHSAAELDGGNRYIGG